MLEKAISITAKAFEGKKDKGGKPYILHCLRVMNGVDQNDEELMSIAVMHDLLEDCPEEYTPQRLLELGFSDRVVSTVQRLTHHPSLVYAEYIDLIAVNKDATKVKLSDLIDNLNLTRIKKLKEEHLRRIERYHSAFIYLSSKK